MLARFREKLAKTRLEREENANEKSRGDETDDWYALGAVAAAATTTTTISSVIFLQDGTLSRRRGKENSPG